MKNFIITLYFFALIIVSVGCAGIQNVYDSPNYKADVSGKYILFPFKDPSYKERMFSGVGSRFTNKFLAKCSSNGINMIPVINEKFLSSKDINLLDAVAYAKENGADYLITGQITKWIDRPTEWTGQRDIAGLEIFVIKVDTGKVIFSAEMNEFSNIFWSGTPDDFIDTLTTSMTGAFLGQSKINKQNNTTTF